MHTHTHTHTHTSAGVGRTGTFIAIASAGVGRTGTFIAIDVVLEQIAKEQVVDIAGAVNRMCMCVCLCVCVHVFMAVLGTHTICIGTMNEAGALSVVTPYSAGDLSFHYPNSNQLVQEESLGLFWNRNQQKLFLMAHK